MTWNLVVLDSFFSNWHFYPFEVQEAVLDHIDSLGSDPLGFIDRNAATIPTGTLYTHLVIRLDRRSWEFLAYFRLKADVSTVIVEWLHLIP